MTTGSSSLSAEQVHAKGYATFSSDTGGAGVMTERWFRHGERTYRTPHGAVAVTLVGGWYAAPLEEVQKAAL